MNDKMISMVVVTHNSSKYIEKCIESIYNQNYSNFELIIVDNNSQDKTKNILTKIKTKDSVIVKIILNSKNEGYNVANTIGIKNSKGDFIALVNPDSFLEQSWLTNIMQIFEKNENVMIVNGILKNIDWTVQSTGGQMDKYGAVKQRKNNVENYFYAPGAAVLIKKKLLEKIKLDPNLFLYYEDVDLSWQTRLSGYKIGYCKDAIASHVSGHALPGITSKKFYFLAKNRIYVCLKNYSSVKIIYRLFPILFLVIIDGIYYAAKYKKFTYFLSSLKGIFWNIRNYSLLSEQRKKIQSFRIIPDNEIEKEFLEKSIEFSSMK